MFLNVCGLKSKLNCPEFIELVKSHDVNIFVESKTDELDVLNLPNGYLCNSKIRTNCKRKSGGIVVIYREYLKHFLKFIKTSSNFVQWVIFSSDIMKLDKDLLLGCIYLPPENSKYASSEAFNEIEDEMLDILSKNSCCVCTVGDFNAKTRHLNEVVIPDDSLFDILDDIGDDDDFRSYIYDFEELKKLYFPLSRFSEDISPANNYGYKLIDFCKRNNLYIGNGRLMGNDYMIGQKTCKNVSLIDYILLSSSAIPIVKMFNVLEFNPLFSDVHNALQFTFHATMNNFTTHSNDTHHEQATRIPRWNTNKENRFVEVVQDDIETINEINKKLNDLNDAGQDGKNIVNDIVNSIGGLFKKAATHAFSKKHNHKKYAPHKTFQVWFNGECHESRQKFHKARNRYSFIKNLHNRNELKKASKEYKQNMNKAYNNYKHKMEAELRKTSKTNPKGLWKILNKLKHNKTSDEANISVDTLYNYFKSLNENPNDDDEFDIDQMIDPSIVNMLDFDITDDEIISAVKSLKNSKAAAEDGIVNEYIKSTLNLMLPTYNKLFNYVFDSGTIPDAWLTGIIKPVYKNKGDKNDLDNYRAICLTSNLGKVFTSIMNTRLNTFADELELITQAQGGFRKGFSVQDNTFVLHSLISLYLSSGRKLFCAFIDFKKAFDTVWRVGLYQKLLKSGIDGKMFRLIYNMYSDIKSCVHYGESKTDYFTCEIGVRQGEKLSPFLFSVYLNDLESYLDENSCSNLQFLDSVFFDRLGEYLKLFILLYADDTVIFADTEEELQNSLRVFESYCTSWKLKVNTNKTKIVIFCNRRCQCNFHFTLFNDNVEKCDSYTYLGLLFNFNGRFCKARDKLINQAQKAMYALYHKIRNLHIPIDLQLRLFDALVTPILTYSSEVWGFENLSSIEKIHLQFCKKILGVRSSTPNIMIYGELGRYPLETNIKVRMVCFWYKLMINKNKLSGKLCDLLYSLYANGNRSLKWISFVKSIFDNIGMSEIWDNVNFYTLNALKDIVKQRLQDQFIQKWFSDTDNSSRGKYYSNFKTEFCFEPYLIRLKEASRLYICKARTCNLKIPIETGRWNRIPENERICTLCGSDIGNELHYIAHCSNNSVTEIRNEYIPPYYRTNPTPHKFYGMLKYCNIKVLTHLSIFLRKVEKILSTSR